MLLLQKLIATAKKDGKTAGGVVAAGKAALAAVGEMVWGFPATIETVRLATKPGDNPYTSDDTGVKTHATLDAIADAILMLQK